MSQNEIDEFNEVFDEMTVDLQAKVTTLLTNYRIEKSDFATKFEKLKYNLKREARDADVTDLQVIRALEEELRAEKTATGKKSFGEYQTIKSKVAVSSKGKVVVE